MGNEDDKPSRLPDSSADAIPRPEIVKSPGSGAVARPAGERANEEVRQFEQFFAAGHAQFNALTQLPKEVQLRQLENDGQRDQMQFQLEQQRLKLMVEDREAERKARLQQSESQSRDDRRTETLHFAYIVGITVMLAALIAFLFWKDKTDAATHLITGSISLGAGWLGGRSNGYTKARKEFLKDVKSNDRADEA